jgi:two-component system OmpR family response regulator
MKVLLIEDEPRIAEVVCTALSAKSWRVVHCLDGRQGFARALNEPFEAIVLDLMLPGMDGMEVLRRLRENQLETPILLLTARNELGDRIEGLNLGADDYLAKPFFVEELAARLQALVRRLRGERQHLLALGSLTLDRLSRELRQSGKAIELTTREYALVEYLMRSAGHTFSRAQILEHVWGFDFDPATNVVDVCVKRIRSKLDELEPARSGCLESVRGIGYRFSPPPAA